MSEAEMMRRIEELVGIRAIVGKNRVSKSGLGLYARTGGVPPAPKAVRTRGAAWRPYDKVPWEEMEVDATDEDSNITIEDAVMGSSPLASRTKSGERAGGRKDASRLAILREENEGSDSQEDGPDDNEGRPSKRQRISSGSAAQNSGEVRQTIQEGRQSRLIENMDLSGSPLLVEEDDTAMAVARAATKEDRAKMSEGSVEWPPQRRRSARIKEIVLSRASSVDRRRNISLDAANLKPSMLRSRSFSSRRTSGTSPPSAGGSEDVRDPSALRECTIRLPFTITPQQKSDSSAVVAKTECSLGRSQSEKYPRAADLAFVTINRPRYRFAQRKLKGSKATKGDQEHSPSVSVSPAHAKGQVQQDIQIGADYSDEKHEKENQEPKIVTKNSGTGGLDTGSLSSSAFYKLPHNTLQSGFDEYHRIHLESRKRWRLASRCRCCVGHYQRHCGWSTVLRNTFRKL
ncbi:hypothetical protein JVU11DRAFT_10382 [Chiua virens]|nr:hypothetical protein JVU11DRAFT_10382 [Chiua virens]